VLDAQGKPFRDHVLNAATNDRPDLSSERALQIRQDCNFQKKNISGQKSQIGLDTKTY
jgi:hypothetical protein